MIEVEQKNLAGGVLYHGTLGGTVGPVSIPATTY